MLLHVENFYCENFSKMSLVLDMRGWENLFSKFLHVLHESELNDVYLLIHIILGYAIKKFICGNFEIKILIFWKVQKPRNLNWEFPKKYILWSQRHLDTKKFYSGLTSHKKISIQHVEFLADKIFFAKTKKSWEFPKNAKIVRQNILSFCKLNLFWS